MSVDKILADTVMELECIWIPRLEACRVSMDEVPGNIILHEGFGKALGGFLAIFEAYDADLIVRSSCGVVRLGHNRYGLDLRFGFNGDSTIDSLHGGDSQFIDRNALQFDYQTNQ